MRIRNWHLAGFPVLVKLLTTDKSWEIDNGEVDLIGTLYCDMQGSLTQGLTFKLRSKNLAACLCSASTSGPGARRRETSVAKRVQRVS